MNFKSGIWGFFLIGVLAGAITFFSFTGGGARASGIFEILDVGGGGRRSVIVKLIKPIRETHKIVVQWTYLSDTKLKVKAEPKNEGTIK